MSIKAVEQLLRSAELLEQLADRIDAEDARLGVVHQALGVPSRPMGGTTELRQEAAACRAAAAELTTHGKH